MKTNLLLILFYLISVDFKIKLGYRKIDIWLVHLQMKILLIQPPLRPSLETFSAIDMIAPSIGLAYLASVLERAKHSVQILDAPPLKINFNQLPKELERYKPDFIGITATTTIIPEALLTAEIAKKIIPHVNIALGGAHITFTQERTMKEKSVVDIGCIGEGEDTIVEVAQTLENHGDLKDVKGIIYRKDGGLVKTPARPFISDLDSLPFPARHLLPMEHYSAFGKKIILGAILTSRGCPFSCTFCSSSLLFGKKFRARSSKNVVDEIEVFQKTYHTKHVEFIDDIFTLDKKRAIAICDEIIQRNLGTEWACSSRVDLMSKELMKKLKEAGCALLYFGVESGVQRVVNLMKKGTKIEQAVNIIRWAKEFRVETLASYVIGIPGETWDEAMQTIKFAKKMDTDYVQFAIATPFPGTELYQTAKEEGLLYSEDWKNYTVLRPVMRTKELSIEQLRKLIRKAYISYYLRPKTIFRYIQRRHTKEIVVNVMFKYILQKMKTLGR